MSKATQSVFTVVDNSPSNSTWDGSPTVLAQNENIVMPQTTNGTMIFAATNQATKNNAGQVALTSGGGAPDFVDVPALANQPTMLVKNWAANNLSVTNLSVATETPILVQAVGPGLPGTTPADLEIGTALSLEAGKTAQGTASPQYMQLVLTSNSAKLGIVGVIGGPQNASGVNGFAIAINSDKNTGPGGDTPPAGYYATTTANHYALPFNWGSSSVFIANMSPSTSDPVTALLRAL